MREDELDEFYFLEAEANQSLGDEGGFQEQ